MTKELALWKPTEDMQKIFEIAASPDTTDNITEWFRRAGMEEKRNKWLSWQKNPQFVKWWNENWNKVMRAAVTYLDKVGLELARTDCRYWEAMQKKYGGYQEQKNQAMPTIVFNIPRPETVKAEIIEGDIIDGDQV